ncbi:MAG: hypothetical protein LBP93_01250 [Treponema sp.]|jgi:hypothetical protein|nr:hypothetical protein [Treponema sp.]
MKAKQNTNGYADFPEYETCVLILKQEIELMEKISSLQLLVRNAVFNREWVDFEIFLGSLGEISNDFESLEFERERIFSAFAQKTGGKDEPAGFYTLASRLPDRERRELTGLYRRLKLESIRIRLANDSLAAYLREARTTVAGFLEAAFPDRKGKLYSRRGTQIPSDMRSMVLNQRL